MSELTTNRANNALAGIVVAPLHRYYRPAHLEHVISQMRVLGAPRIRAYCDGETWFAREGTHRLRAAKALGIAPVLVPVPWWRSRAALNRAHFAALDYGHVFPHVEIYRE